MKKNFDFIAYENVHISAANHLTADAIYKHPNGGTAKAYGVILARQYKAGALQWLRDDDKAIEAVREFMAETGIEIELPVDVMPDALK